MLASVLKGLFARRLRMSLAVAAVVLGTAFVAGTFVLTSTLQARFQQSLATINPNVAVRVQPTDQALQDSPSTPVLDQNTLNRLRAVVGVAQLSPEVSTDAVTPHRKRDGKPLGAADTTYGAGVQPSGDPLALWSVHSGRLPQQAGEVAVTSYTATQSQVVLGDPLTLEVANDTGTVTQQYRVVGVLGYPGGRGTLDGSGLVVFHLPEAQRLFYGAEGRYGGALLATGHGVSATELRDRVAAVLPAGFVAITAQEIAKRDSNDLKQDMRFMTLFFLGFAAVSVLVGTFLVFNTFTILVAQRSHELALYRALGAGRSQVTGSVLTEAVVVGLVGSTLGLLAGIGIGAAGASLVGQQFGSALPTGGLIIPLTGGAACYAVGLTITLLAALVPAIRASAVPPVAALRDLVRGEKSLVGISLVGLLLTAPGLLLVWSALAGRLQPRNRIPGAAAGLLLAVLGVALLMPLLTRPVAGLLGAALAWGQASRLGRRNALRNPRRTAVTAAALMVGITLITAVSTVGTSFRASILSQVDEIVGADIVISADSQPDPQAPPYGFNPARLDQVRRIPGVQAAVPVYTDSAVVAGRPEEQVSASDLAALASLTKLKPAAGTLRHLADREAVVDVDTAKRNKWHVGDLVSVALNRGGDRQYRLVGIYRKATVSGLILPVASVPDFRSQLATSGYLQTSRGADVAVVRREVERTFADTPNLAYFDRAEFEKQVNQVVNTALGIVLGLLGLAVLIAVLGIANTLLLSIHERTRELGLLRAIGATRTQVKRMIRVEAIVLALFGSVLGLGLGLGLGVVVAHALIKRAVLNRVVLPGAQLLAVLALAALVGLIAAWLPALRASRLNVLRAIAQE